MSIIGHAIRFMAIGTVFVGLTACATLNEEECQTADWYSLGQQDGEQGRNQSHLSEHRRACERHGLPVDQSAWLSGWDSGIQRYCTPQNGLNEGRQGRYYANSCPAGQSAGFESAYRVAKRLHDTRQSRDRLEREVEEQERKVRDADDRQARRDAERELDRRSDALSRARRDVREAQSDYDDYIFANRLAMR